VNIQQLLEANRPRKIDPREIHTVVTLQEMELAFRDYVRLRKIQFSGPRSREKPIREYFEAKIAYIEGRFPAFRPAYEERFAR
jgi:hypothetical protein